MKKSIKYAGIAAATLLAVAPVAAPVVSNATTTVKAADTDTNTSSMNDFTGQYVDYTIPTSATLTDVSDAAFGNNKSITAFDTSFSQFVKFSLTNHAAVAADLALTTEGKAAATVNVSAKTGNGTTVNSAAELNQYLNDNTTKSIVVTAVFNYKTSDGSNATPITKTFTLTKASVATSDITSAAVNYTNSKDVEYNSSNADYKLVDSSDISIKDNNGKELIDGKATGLTKTVGQTFYTSYNDAYNAATTGDTTTTGSSTFSKANTTYYQVVKVAFPANSAFATFLTNHALHSSDYALTINGVTPTGNYNDQTSFQTGTATDGSKFVTVIRSFKTGSAEAANWTTEDVKGVVTTKSDSAFYTLKNGSNETISNRALAKNSAWQTNAVRTNTKTGEKQYRVGADEWISANDVTFSDGNDGNGSTTGAYTDVKALNGKVTTAGPAGYYYPLYNDNGELISNRGVAGLTSWYTDKSAKNADGVTVYHVATGEWLQGTNVTYSAY